MKALELKRISWSLVTMVIMCLAVFTACSEDDENGESVVFPELQDEVYNAGETFNLSFNAAADWTLTSSASWCKFVDGDFKETTRSGKAGAQTVVVEISDEGLDYNNDNTAEIVLKMGAKEQVIYRVTRLKKLMGNFIVQSVPEAEGEDIVVYGEENPIVVKGCDVDADRDGYLLVETIAEGNNLQVGVREENTPEWLNVEKVEAGFKLSFNRNNSEFKFNHSISAEDGGHIIFSVMAPDNTLLGDVAIPVSYEGLKEGAILVEPGYGNLSVSEDGMTFTEISSNGLTGSTTLKTYEDELNSTVTVRNDQFHVLVGSAVAKEVMGATIYQYDFTETPGWVYVTENATNVKVEAAAFTGSDQRGAIILVLSDAAYESVKDNLNGNLIDVDDLGGLPSHSIKTEYMNGVMAVLTQEPKTSGKVALTAFYAQDVTDWNTVSESDLTPIDNIGGMMISGDEAKGMLAEAGMEVMGEEAYILSVTNFMKGSSFCIRVDNVPAGYMIGMNYTPWNDDEVSCHEETINGHHYFVLTVLKDNIEVQDPGYSLIVGDPDMGVFSAECYFMFY